MIPVTPTELAATLQWHLIGAGSPFAQSQIELVSTDSRGIIQGGLFVALRGSRFDGHDFAAAAAASGATAVLVERELPLALPQILVRDTLTALGELSAWVRSRVSTRMVALTGSSGKTTVKEMSAAILRQCGTVLATSGNQNNAIGVPLTLLQLRDQHYGVIELGASSPGEIAKTCSMVKPEAVLVTNIAAAHLAGFGSLAGVAQAKGEIFSSLSAGGRAIVNLDSNGFPQWQKLLANNSWSSFSLRDSGADFYASHIVQIGTRGMQFLLHTPQGEAEILLTLLGEHNVANAVAAAAITVELGASLEAISEGLAQLQAFPGRSYPISLTAGKLILDDSYNANVGSMLAALNLLEGMPGYRVLVAGDMTELGERADECYDQVFAGLKRSKIDAVFTVGQGSEALSRWSRGRHFLDLATLLIALRELISRHEKITLLVKGSRSAAMERVVHGLQSPGPNPC